MIYFVRFSISLLNPNIECKNSRFPEIQDGR